MPNFPDPAKFPGLGPGTRGSFSPVTRFDNGVIQVAITQNWGPTSESSVVDGVTFNGRKQFILHSGTMVISEGFSFTAPDGPLTEAEEHFNLDGAIVISKSGAAFSVHFNSKKTLAKFVPVTLDESYTIVGVGEKDRSSDDR